MDNPIEFIIKTLFENKLTLSTCEISTGGIISSRFSSTDKTSKTYKGGYICTNIEDIKNIINFINSAKLNIYGLVSEELCSDIAKQIVHNTKTDVCICVISEDINKIINDKTINSAFLTIVLIDKIYVYKINSNETEYNSIRNDFAASSIYKLFELIKKMNK
ncbi:damage-inducible protein [Bacilli bacterium]|nr:damage-inducible protein [Bacilli bacterium]